MKPVNYLPSKSEIQTSQEDKKDSKETAEKKLQSIEEKEAKMCKEFEKQFGANIKLEIKNKYKYDEDCYDEKKAKFVKPILQKKNNDKN